MKSNRVHLVLLPVFAASLTVAVAPVRAETNQKQAPWAFVVLTDPRPGKYQDKKVPGFRHDLEATRDLFFKNSTQERPAPDWLLVPGDMDPVKTTDREIRKVLGNEFPWVPVIGNHDLKCRETIEKIVKKLGARFKIQQGPKGTENLQFTLKYRNMLLVILNQYWDGTTDPKGATRTNGNHPEASLAWTRKILAASKAPYKIVSGHEPAWPIGRHVGDSLDADSKKRDRFWQILEQGGAQVFFCGHTHYYSTYQWRGNKDPFRWKGYTSSIIPGPTTVWQIDGGTCRGTIKKNRYPRVIIYCKVTDKKLEIEAYVSERDKNGNWGRWRIPPDDYPSKKTPARYRLAVSPSPTARGQP